jgi:hypothetical protein
LLLQEEQEPLEHPAQPLVLPPATILEPLWAKNTDNARWV